ncbi:leucine-rich_repeat domain-containing protein [Hexamita inflata]|uniref:Leucine-rich repeat domain-containing protein n=1 Tax=Hexamita inflata TaxID=28002 RepID=A0AA86R7Y5_9EUKA|nr:leucine-rich repeat domain-containing protein [Hexamita inflata]
MPLQNEMNSKEISLNFRNLVNNGVLLIQKCEQLTDLSFLSQFNLFELNIWECKNLIPELSLSPLTKLQISECQLNSIQLFNMQSLQILVLSKNNLTNIEQLKSLNNLKYLDLSWNSIVDIATIRFLKNLKELYFQENEISDITVLRDLKELIILNLHWNEIVSIHPLKELKNLVSVDLSNNNIIDIAILEEENIKYIKTLKINENKVLNLNIINNAINNQENLNSSITDDWADINTIYPQCEATLGEICFSKTMDNNNV